MTSFHIYFGCLLVLVAGVMGTLAVRSALQVFRLRNKRLSWRSGTMAGYPFFSTLFMVFSIAFAATMWLNGSQWNFLAATFYVFISVSWFLTSYLSSTRYVTDNGLVKNVNDPSQTIAWHQIRDFVETSEENRLAFTFIYQEMHDEGTLRRLELVIPARNVENFKKLISHKLGRRITCYDDILFTVQDFN